MADQVDWPLVEDETHRRDQLNPLIELVETYERVFGEVESRAKVD